MPRFEWYEVVGGGELQQGDILEGVDIYIALPEQEGQEGSVDSVVEVHDVIVLTQSCDIIKTDCENIIVCPIWTLEEAKRAIPHFRSRKGLEDLRQGFVVGYHLIARCDEPDFQRDLRVVNFRRVFEISKSRAVTIACAEPQRLRLLPPYREHLAQAFARFFMRVGLPTDIPSFV